VRGRRGDERAQLQLLESIMVALFIFVAIAVVSIHRLPTSPQAFTASGLQKLANDALKVRQAKTPVSTDDCNDTPCPFANDLERLLSLTLGYVGKHTGTGEAANSSEFKSYLDQALPAGSRYQLAFGTGHNQTLLFPLGVVPPVTSVVVGRTIVAPNWTVFASNAVNGTILRVSERTGLLNAATIQDPLNRTTTEWNKAWTNFFSTGYQARVPANATFGTHRVCFGAAAPTGCYNLTVVPANISGVVGAGAQVLPGDRDADSVIRDYNAGATTLNLLAYWNDQLPLGASAKDRSYLHKPTIPPQLVAVGDIRLSYVDGACRNGSPCAAGSIVRTGDLDVGGVLTAFTATTTKLRASNATVLEGTRLYLLANDAATTPAAGDVRLSRAGVHPLGSRVRSFDEDVGGSALTALDLTQVSVQYADKDNDNVLDEDEPVYFNLLGLGQSSALDTYDYHVTNVAAPPQRSLYNVKLEVWYGV
jgi:hypothetical protein